MAPTATVWAMNQDRNIAKEEQMEEEKEMDEGMNEVNEVNVGEVKANEAEAEERAYIEGTIEQEVKISISHDGDYATAVCLAAKELPWRAKHARALAGQSERHGKIKDIHSASLGG